MYHTKQIYIRWRCSTYEIWGFHGSRYSRSGVLGFDAV